MIKKIFSLTALVFAGLMAFAQDNVYPAPPQTKPVAITNATIHVGNGTVIEKGTIVFDNGKITAVGTNASVPSGATVIDASGKHVYPGLILPNSQLGIQEVGAGTRATNDFQELGTMNPNVRTIVAYNTDSKITNTLRSNGVLLAEVVPNGGRLSGTSTMVQLDAWNWEDAAYRWDGIVHFRMPSLLNRPTGFGGGGFRPGGATGGDRIKAALDEIEDVKNFFREARSYAQVKNPKDVNLKFEALKPLFNKEGKLLIHCNTVKEMLVAIEFKKEFGFDIAIVGGSESFRIADLLKENDVPVILGSVHALPTTPDDDVDQPFKTPAMLHKAGVLFAIGDEDYHNRGRNMMFNAGTAVAYGLPKEAAISAMTLNTAKILGVADKTGSLEVGKDANIVISEGDILDMRSSIVTHAFIQGRNINLDNKQRQLFERYKYKYNLK